MKMFLQKQFCLIVEGKSLATRRKVKKVFPFIPPLILFFQGLSLDDKDSNYSYTIEAALRYHIYSHFYQINSMHIVPNYPYS